MPRSLRRILDLGRTFSCRFIFPFPLIPSIPLQRMYHECIGPRPVFVGRLRRYIHSVVESTEKMYLYCSRITSKCSYVESSSRFPSFNLDPLSPDETVREETENQQRESNGNPVDTAAMAATKGATRVVVVVGQGYRAS